MFRLPGLLLQKLLSLPCLFGAVSELSEFLCSRLKQSESPPNKISVQFSRSVVSNSLQPPWTTAHQSSLSITNSWILLKLMSIKSVLPSNHLILCLLLLPSIIPSTRVFRMSQFLASGGQSTGVSASPSVFQMNTQD